VQFQKGEQMLLPEVIASRKPSSEKLKGTFQIPTTLFSADFAQFAIETNQEDGE
jgi:hypothetical protein